MPIDDERKDHAPLDETPEHEDAPADGGPVHDRRNDAGEAPGVEGVADAGEPLATAGGADSEVPAVTGEAGRGEETEPSMTVDAVMESGPAEQAVSEQLVAVLEAIVFASPEPITPKQIFKLLDAEPKEDVQAALAELEARYHARGGGLQLVEVAGGYQIVTRPELAEWVRRMFHERTTQKLSVQALETLAVIAYKQPITAAEITEIRAVNTSGVIGTLLERGLVKISGRKQVVGRPFLYSTTREFLDRFGLRDLSDLPKVEDMAGALGFEPPVGLAVDAIDTLPLTDEPATEDDVAVLTGEGGEDAETDEPDDRSEKG